MYRHPVTPCAPRPLQIYSSSSEGKALRSVHFRSINGPNRPQQSYLTDADGSPLPPHRKTAAVISVWASAAPSPAPDHEAAGSYLTPPPAGPLWTSGLERDEKKTKGFFFPFLLSVWISLREYILICLWMYSWEHSETLTSPQSSDALLQPVHLAGLILAWILVDDRQVLIPVAPVHLIHPDITKHQWSWRFCLVFWKWSSCVSVIGTLEEYLKHQRRSGVPSQFFPTVTISPARKDLRRQTGKERSMSKMVVAHCEYTQSLTSRLCTTSASLDIKFSTYISGI